MAPDVPEQRRRQDAEKMGPRGRRELGNRICAEIFFISVNYFKKT